MTLSGITFILVISGFVLASVFQMLYLFVRNPRKSIFILLVATVTASVYIINEYFILAHVLPGSDSAVWHQAIAVKLLAPLIFIIIIPYYINLKFTMENIHLRRMNTFFSALGIVVFFTMTFLAILNPEYLINFENKQALVDNTKPGTMSGLFIARSIVFMVYFIYLLPMTLYLWHRIYRSYAYKYIIVGIIIITYMGLTFIYSVFFGNGSLWFLYTHAHYIVLCMILFVIFISLGLIDHLTFLGSKFEKLEGSYHDLLYVDPVLKIANRRAFIKDLRDLLKRNEDGEFFSIIFIDIDDFGNFNECYGDNTADNLLKNFSERILEIFSDQGKLYRIGGDDFTFILHGKSSKSYVEDVAHRMISSLRNSFVISEIKYHITASLGLIFVPENGSTVSEILRNGYSAIDISKRRKNTVEVFDPVIAVDMIRKIDKVNILGNAIYRDEFTMFYQPIVNSSEELVHAESLLRCTVGDPLIGGPGDFIPLIEEAGLSKELDIMVIDKTFRDMEVKIKNRFSTGINLSTDQLVNPEFVDFLSSFADQYKIEKGNIVLEVTENRLIENLQLGRESLLRFKEDGFRLAIDDFGKGFSSLSYLTELPIDIIKIDMEFIDSVPGNEKRENVVRHIIEIGHSLDLKVVTEGVETLEQFDFLREHGCDLFQGYYFSRPMPLCDILEKYSKK